MLLIKPCKIASKISSKVHIYNQVSLIMKMRKMFKRINSKSSINQITGNRIKILKIKEKEDPEEEKSKRIRRRRRRRKEWE